ncbi:hypothetical protein CJ030_MR7G009301 [Morella rubra]|uniref:Uncharacterized protein n=1 Tax=Morella rubra TaxID=262757 RepID=A0A6A1V097_9ROSI|nr:hypothetical protein CJ030_MR7G009301 [Morella rubra]
MEDTRTVWQPENAKRPNGLGTTVVHMSSFMDAKRKKVKIAIGMHGANDEEGEVKLEAAACDSDSLQRQGSFGGLLRPPSKWAPIVCPLRHPWTRVRGSNVWRARPGL